MDTTNRKTKYEREAAIVIGTTYDVLTVISQTRGWRYHVTCAAGHKMTLSPTEIRAGVCMACVGGDIPKIAPDRLRVIALAELERRVRACLNAGVDPASSGITLEGLEHELRQDPDMVDELWAKPDRYEPVQSYGVYQSPLSSWIA